MLKSVLVRIITCVVCISMLTVFAPVSAAQETGSDKPSQWAEREIAEAINNDLVPEQLQSNYRSNIKRSQYVLLALKVFDAAGKSVDIKESRPFIDTLGHKYEQEIVKDDLLYKKGPAIKDAIENNKVFLAICGGYQLLGKYYKTKDGKELEFLGALDFWTNGEQKRMIGNIVMECDFLKSDTFDGKIVGFENHSGKTYLGKGIAPLGKVIVGYGNNGEDGYEGAVYKNVYCSYLHGSLLPKNPALTDFLLEKALNNKYKGFGTISNLDDSYELAARNSIINRLITSNKMNKLRKIF